jgi:hypothetical protein
MPTAVSGTVVVLATLVALVYMLGKGQDIAPLIAFVSPVLAAFGISAKLDGQNVQLNTISENVNGKLDARIRAAVHDVLDERETPAP